MIHCSHSLSDSLSNPVLRVKRLFHSDLMVKRRQARWMQVAASWLAVKGTSSQTVAIRHTRVSVRTTLFRFLHSVLPTWMFLPCDMRGHSTISSEKMTPRVSKISMWSNIKSSWHSNFNSFRICFSVWINLSLVGLIQHLKNSLLYMLLAMA